MHRNGRCTPARAWPHRRAPSSSPRERVRNSKTLRERRTPIHDSGPPPPASKRQDLHAALLVRRSSKLRSGNALAAPESRAGGVHSNPTWPVALATSERPHPARTARAPSCRARVSARATKMGRGRAIKKSVLFLTEVLTLRITSSDCRRAVPATKGALATAGVNRMSRRARERSDRSGNHPVIRRTNVPRVMNSPITETA